MTHGVHMQGHPCRYRRGLTPTQVSTGLNEEDTTAKVEGAASWGRGRGVATQRSGAQHRGSCPVCIGREDAGDDVEHKLHRR